MLNLVDYSYLKAKASSLHQHARTCKKFLAECVVCQKSMKEFNSWPLLGLSVALQDTLAACGRFSMASVCLDNLMAQSLQVERSKRAKANFGAGFGVLKAYEVAGGVL